MSWVVLCLIVAFLFAICAFFDNYITDVIFKDKLPQSVKAYNCFFYPVVAILIALIFGVESMPLQTALIVFASGIIHSISSIPYFLALRDEETTTAATYYQLQPVLCFFADIFILGKVITYQQINALIIIIMAPIVIAIAERGKGKRSRKKHLRGGLYLILYVLIASLSTVMFARASDGSADSMSLLFWYILGRAFFDTVGTLAHKTWRNRAKEVFRSNRAKVLGVYLASAITYTVGDFLLRYTLSLTNSSFATAITNATELILTFILGIILTLIWPKFGREKLDKRNIAAHLVAVIMVIASIIMIQ